MIELRMTDLSKFTDACTDIARNYPEGTAEKNFEEAVTIGKELLQEGQDTKAAYDALGIGMDKRSAQLVALRKEQEAETEPAFTEALSSADMDAGKHAKAYPTRAQLINFLVGAIEFGREALLPAALLKMLDAQHRMASAGAKIADWTSVVAGVERYQASQALLATDGAVVFSAMGKAYDYWVQAAECHRLAYRAYEALDHARKVAAERKQLKGLL